MAINKDRNLIKDFDVNYEEVLLIHYYYNL